MWVAPTLFDERGCRDCLCMPVLSIRTVLRLVNHMFYIVHDSMSYKQVRSLSGDMCCMYSVTVQSRGCPK